LTSWYLIRISAIRLLAPFGQLGKRRRASRDEAAQHDLMHHALKIGPGSTSVPVDVAKDLGSSVDGTCACSKEVQIIAAVRA
jgi:hypothetical protein